MHNQQEFIEYVTANSLQISGLLDTLFGRSNHVISINDYDIRTIESSRIPSQHFGAYVLNLKNGPDLDSMRHIWVWCCAANVYCAIMEAGLTGLSEDNVKTIDTVKTIADEGWAALHISTSIWKRYLEETAPTIENVMRNLERGSPRTLEKLPCAPVIPWLTPFYPEVGPWRGEILDSDFPVSDLIVQDGQNSMLSIGGRFYEWSMPEKSIMAKLSTYSSSCFAFYHKDKAFRVSRAGQGPAAQYALRMLCLTPPSWTH